MTVLTGSLKDKKKKKKLSFFREVQQELKKVNWTSKEELKTSTKVVIGSTFVFGLGIYLMDLVIRGSLHGLSLLTQLIVG